jgi:thiamine-phosphate pyrophosphorylase
MRCNSLLYREFVSLFVSNIAGYTQLHMLRYCITDRASLEAGTNSLDALFERILEIAPGIDFLQIRERDLPAAELERFVTRVMAALAELPRAPQVLINHRADVAVACALAAAGRDWAMPGVHLRSGAGKLSPGQVRALYSAAELQPPLVSVSCHTVEEVRRAAEQQVDLILSGPVFEKAVEGEIVQPGSGLELLRAAFLAAGTVPVLALGGVTAANSPECLAAGAAGIAGIRLFLRP